MPRIRVRVLVAVIALAAASTSPLGAQSTSTSAALGRNVVRNVLGAKANDVILINADPSQLVLAETLENELRQVGAFGIVTIGSARGRAMYFKNVPATFDSQLPLAGMKLASIVTGEIFIDPPTDPVTARLIPAARAAAVGKAAEPLDAYLKNHNIAVVQIGNGLMPSPTTAAQFGVTLSELSSVFTSGIDTDYTKLVTDGTWLRKAVLSKAVHVAAPNGTDFTFTATSNGGFVNGGTITASDRAAGGTSLFKQLPAGDVYFTPEPNSIDGTVVFGASQLDGNVVRELKLHYVAGKMTSMSVGRGKATFDRYYSVGSSGRDELSWIDFGVNRSMKLPAAPTWGAGPSMAAGYVSLGLGYNKNFGGENASTFGFISSVPNATVTVDGRTIVRHGALMPLR